MRLVSTCDTNGDTGCERLIVRLVARLVIVRLIVLGFECSGVDTREFLQGLVTNDVYKLDESNDDGIAASAGFLTPKGRMIAEVIVYRVAPDVFLLDCAMDNAPTVTKLLNFYKLKKDVTVRDASESYNVWEIMSTGQAEQGRAALSNVAKATIVVNDPRWQRLGCRILSSCHKSVHAEEIRKALKKCGFMETKLQTWTLWRMMNGIVEGLEAKDKIVQEINMEKLNGVSFDKGCYTGQELVARTHHKGQVRKRVLPVRLSKDPINDRTDFEESLLLPRWIGDVSREEPQSLEFPINLEYIEGDTSEKSKSARAPGKIIAGSINESSGIGLALVRLAEDGTVNPDYLNPGKLSANGLHCWIPEIPKWWSQTQ